MRYQRYKMQEDFKRLVPRIVYTAALSDICGHGCHSVQVDILDENEHEEKVLSKQKRISRSRSKRNPRRLSISTDRQSSSSSRSPSPPSNDDRNPRDTRVNKRSLQFNNSNETSAGYKEYLQLLTVPHPNYALLEWGEASGDDLSSEWDSDYSESTLQLDNHAKSTISEVNSSPEVAVDVYATHCSTCFVRGNSSKQYGIVFLLFRSTSIQIESTSSETQVDQKKMLKWFYFCGEFFWFFSLESWCWLILLVGVTLLVQCNLTWNATILMYARHWKSWLNKNTALKVCYHVVKCWIATFLWKFIFLSIIFMISISISMPLRSLEHQIYSDNSSSNTMNNEHILSTMSLRFKNDSRACKCNVILVCAVWHHHWHIMPRIYLEISITTYHMT